MEFIYFLIAMYAHYSLGYGWGTIMIAYLLFCGAICLAVFIVGKFS